MNIRFCRDWLSRFNPALGVFLLIGFPLLAAGQGKKDALSQAEKLMSQATASAELGHYPQAMESGREALTIRTEELGADHLLVAETLRRLGEYCSYGGQPNEGIEHLNLAIEILERSGDLEKSHRDLIKTLRSLGTACFQAKKSDEAVAAFKRIVRMQEPIKDKDGDWEALSAAVANLAFVLKFQNEFEQAEKEYLRLVKIFRQHLPTAESKLGHALIDLAGVHQPLKKFAQAETEYKEALAIIRKSEGEVSFRTLSIFQNLKELYEQTEQPDKANAMAAEMEGIESKLERPAATVIVPRNELANEEGVLMIAMQPGDGFYHRPSCSLVYDGYYRVELGMAIEGGFERCRICKPPAESP